MAWYLTRTTYATEVAVILLQDRVEDPELKVVVGVQDARITSTPMTTGRIEAVGMALAVMKGDHDTDITGEDDSNIHYTLCITLEPRA